MICMNSTTASSVSAPAAASKAARKPKTTYDQALLDANLAALFLPEIREVPVDVEFGGRALSEAEHLELVAEAAPLREWLVRWMGLISKDRLCHRERQDKNAKPAGTLAGHNNGKGYLVTWVLGRNRPNHQLIWLLYYGRLPASGMVIDHIDGNRQNNRIANLREVSIQGNNLNASHNDDSLPHGLIRHTKEGGKCHYVCARIAIPAAIHQPGAAKRRTKNIRIQPWPKNPDGSPSLGEDGQPLRHEDELVAIATLAPLWRSWRAELYGVAAN